MTEKSPTFKLRIAKSFVEDVIDGQVSPSLAVKQLYNAIELATEVAASQPSLELDDGTNHEEIIASAYRQLGLIQVDKAKESRDPNDWNKAQEFFEKSSQAMPTQRAAFGIALCMHGAIKESKGGARFIRKVGGGKIYYTPLFREKPAKDELMTTLEHVIELDPDSELAVEAGKLLVKLKLK
ncbi:MAG: hypothetical protein DDT32_02141 [Syntrophomonadaceae bacterium]|nr:hypothetical protein [Bacillota bacterium]